MWPTLSFCFSPAAARKFFDEGVKTLEGLFSRCLVADFQESYVIEHFVISLNEQQSVYLTEYLDLKKIEHKLNHHQKIGLM